jgi:hypothetical protein
VAWAIIHEQDGRQHEQDRSKGWRAENEKGDAILNFTAAQHE